jgi:hypothetical protein
MNIFKKGYSKKENHPSTLDSSLSIYELKDLFAHYAEKDDFYNAYDLFKDMGLHVVLYIMTFLVFELYRNKK